MTISGTIVLFILFAAIIVIILVMIYNKSQRSNGSQAVNPSKNYWFWRSDGSGVQHYNPEPGVYLRQTITSMPSIGSCSATEACPFGGTCRNGKCSQHTNSEIYNNPCCKSQLSPQLCSQIPSAVPQTFDPSGSLSELFREGTCAVFEALCSVNDDIQGNFSSWNTSDDCKIIPTTVPVDVPWDVSQLFRDTFLNNPYLYKNLKIRVKCSNIKDGKGSRGWGFWTTQYPWQCIWFINTNGNELDGSVSKQQGLWGWIVGIDAAGKMFGTMKRFSDLDENEHEYEIIWTCKKIQFLIDGKIVLDYNDQIPSVYMALHCWIDNFIYSFNDKGVAFLSDFFPGVQSQDISYLEISN